MTNKPILSVDRQLIEKAMQACFEAGHGITHDELRALLDKASCIKCNDTGEADSGGVQPWGEGINIPCDCAPAAQHHGYPVAWQYRVSAGPATGWSLWHDGKGEEFKNSYQVETRPLYAEQPAPVLRCSFCDVTDNDGNPWSGHHESVDGKLIYRVMGCKDHKHLVEALDGSKPAPVAVTHTMRSVMEAYAAARKEHLTGTSNFCAAMAARLNGVKP